MTAVTAISADEFLAGDYPIGSELIDGVVHMNDPTFLHQRICSLLPAVAPSVAIYSTVGLGATIGQATALSFLGLDAPPPSPEWVRCSRPGCRT
jgi:ABC-type antimicrobial peptide transport system permease subunit